MITEPSTASAPATAGPRVAVPVKPSPTRDVRQVGAAIRSGNLIDVTDVGGASFATPSGNIACDLYTPSTETLYPDGRIRCDIRTSTITPPPQPADCFLDWGQSLILVTTAEFGCIGDAITGNALTTSDRVLSWWDRSSDGTATTYVGVSAALPYGKTIIAGDRRCTSTEAGLTCQNTRTHAQFFLCRDRFTLAN